MHAFYWLKKCLLLTLAMQTVQLRHHVKQGNHVHMAGACHTSVHMPCDSKVRSSLPPSVLYMIDTHNSAPITTA